MRASVVFLLALLLLSGGAALASNHAPGGADLSDTGVAVDSWVFLTGDAPGRAAPDLDDSDWVPLTDDQVLLDPESAEELKWAGTGWFRRVLRVPRRLWGRRVGLLYFQNGAAQVYLNGRLVAEVGTVGNSPETERSRIVDDDYPVVLPVVLDAAFEQVLAVRYSNTWSQGHPRLTFARGFSLYIADFDEAVEFRMSQARSITRRQLLFAVPLAFGLLHLLLFLFYPPATENLYYALFAGVISVLAFYPFQAAFIQTPAGFLLFLAVFKSVLVLTPFLGVTFFYMAFRGTCPKYLKFPAVLGFVLIVCSWLIPIEVYYLFALAALPEMARIIGMSAITNKRGARIVAVGFSVFMVASAYQMLMELGVFEQDHSFPFLYGILALMGSVSVYLAREFGWINLRLEEQIVKVKALSEQSLEQERRVREQEECSLKGEADRRVLETESAAQDRELAEIRQRQTILEELEAVNKDLVDTQTQLVQSEKMASLGNLIAGIAHEINTPVGAINSMHDTLVRAVGRLRGVLERDYLEAMSDSRAVDSALRVVSDANQVISAGAERVTGIVRSLRNFARLDEAERKRVDLHEGIDSTLVLLHHELKNRIRVEKRYGEIPEVVCYPSRLNQVFLNLVVNAAQAIEGEGEITLQTQGVGESVEITISDSGPGISEEHLPRLFEPGFTTKSVGTGTGLGLSICDQIVQDHGGSIAARNQEGGGAAFTVSIPITANPAD